ncbi:protein THEM6-like [Megalops cyprinoides]|uniref:protein THEM6-like n=1 Tax=Megalops cyprinoides TaxID=118141 RepID=UPI001863A9B4|nr:protein THEM6-like [Megalops cyprinoides]XP_036374542.1 protein THEM6-like [Megalops cyprinoides]XP_036374543.1 protein THEM6-like [Megalops cyprinoides]XP_036374544.1 protein THEM6-like [Megalops cyprinoides]
MLLWVLAVLLLLFSGLDVWYFLRAAAVVLRAWFQTPVRDVLAEQRFRCWVVPHDIDHMGHVNNARYLRECDFARFSFYTRNGVFRALWATGGSMVVGASTIRYRRSLSLGEAFELRSRVVAWDDRAFYLEQRFVSCADGFVSAVMLCKQTLIRSTPDKILQFLCKRKVESPEFPEDLQHWLSFITASSQALRAESSTEEKNK